MLFYYLSIKLDRECSHSFSNTAAKFIDLSHEDYLHLSFLQTRTLSSIKKRILISALKTISQRVQTVISVFMSTSSFLMQIKQSSLRKADVHNLLNFIKNDNYANINNEPRSSLQRTTDSLNSTTTLILLSTRSSHL